MSAEHQNPPQKLHQKLRQKVCQNFRSERRLTLIGSIVAVLIMVRLALPSVLVNRINQRLGTFSPVYTMHVDRLKLHIWRGAYTLEDVRAQLTETHEEFLNLPKVRIRLAWRELFRGRIVVDVNVVDPDVKLTKSSVDALAGVDPHQAKSDAKTVKDAAIPFNLEQVRLENASILFADVAGLPREQNFQLNHIDAQAANLTPSDDAALSIFTAQGALQGTAKIKLVGEMRMKRNPVEWSVNTEMRDFDLAEINPIARRSIPLTFKKGHLSLFAAARSMKGETKGYVKPFFKDLVLIGDHGDFKNVGQFLIEIAGTVGNFLLKNSKTHTVATKVSFHSENGKMQVDTGKAIGIAIKNGFGDPLTPSLDEALDLI